MLKAELVLPTGLVVDNMAAAGRYFRKQKSAGAAGDITIKAKKWRSDHSSAANTQLRARRSRSYLQLTTAVTSSIICLH